MSDISSVSETPPIAMGLRAGILIGPMVTGQGPTMLPIQTGPRIPRTRQGQTQRRQRFPAKLAPEREPSRPSFPLPRRLRQGRAAEATCVGCGPPPADPSPLDSVVQAPAQAAPFDSHVFQSVLASMLGPGCRPA